MTAPRVALAALDVLEQTARRVDTSEKVHARLSDIQSFFGEDLTYVEQVLADAAEDGPSPGAPAAGHLLRAGGKRVRPLAVLLSAACFGAVPVAARELAVVAELVHSATLLHDDVIDDGMERRGRATSRRIWGNAVSVLAGDLLLTQALDRTLRAAPAALPDLITTLRRLVDGEIVQLRGRTVLDASESVYFRILEDKTASLFGWAARAGAISAGAPDASRDALGAFGERLGVAFQLVDDVLDYTGDPSATGKELLADLSEGKLTLPLVLAIGKVPELASELDLARAGDAAAAHRLGGRVRELGVCDEVRRRAEAETARAIAALTTLPASPARGLLEVLALELTRRRA